VLYTGLSDSSELRDADGRYLSTPTLTLRQEDNGLWLEHMLPPKEGANWLPQAAELTRSQLDLDSLRRDSDADGLSDLLELPLFCDPQKPDTDGDGIMDAEDPSPNANPGQLDRLQRGAARALEYFFRVHPPSRYGVGLPDLAAARQPFRAVYVLAPDSAPLTFAFNQDYYCIAVAADQQGALADLLKGSGAPLMPTVTILESGVQPGPEYAGLDSTAELKLGYPMEGHYVLLRDIGGELYPLLDDMSWIS
jgi:hypothetical protein